MNDTTLPVVVDGATIGFVDEADWRRGGDADLPLTMTHGQRLHVPRDLFTFEGGVLGLDRAALDPANPSGTAGAGDSVARYETQVIPVVEERLEVRRRQVDKGVVRLSKRVVTSDETVELTHLRREAVIERRAVGQFVAEAPSPRQEGDVLIVPVLEEVQVVETRLLLKEEIVVRLEERADVETVEVPLRRETVDIERSGPSEASGDS